MFLRPQHTYAAVRRRCGGGAAAVWRGHAWRAQGEHCWSILERCQCGLWSVGPPRAASSMPPLPYTTPLLAASSGYCKV